MAWVLDEFKCLSQSTVPVHDGDEGIIFNTSKYCCDCNSISVKRITTANCNGAGFDTNTDKRHTKTHRQI